MAHRIHVVSARGIDGAEFQRALASLRPQQPDQPICQPFRFGTSGEWQWAWASVWHVGGDEIDRVITTLPGTALRTTTSDGVLWMLTIAGGGRDLFRGVHFFTSVGRTDWDHVVEEPVEEDDPDFPEHAPSEVAGIERDNAELQFLWDDDEAAAIESQSISDAAAKKPWQEYIDYGVTLPDDVLRQMTGLPELVAARIAFYSHADQIADTLTERGVPFDRDAVVQLLTVGPLTAHEQDSDLGNLPRFLTLLGIVGLVEQEAQDAEEKQAEKSVVDWSRFQGRESMNAVRALTQERSLVPVMGGPVDLSFIEVVHLLTLAKFCDADDGPVMISLRFPAEDLELAEAWTKLGGRGIEVERNGTQCVIAFNPIPYWLDIEDRQELAQHELVQALSTLADGVEVVLAHSVSATSDRFHGYCGLIHDGRFRLTAAHPPLNDNVVRETLELMQLTLGTKAIPIDNLVEENHMREAYYNRTGEKPRIRQGKIKPEPGGRHPVVRCKFVTRFRGRGVWDIEGAERRREEVAAEINALLQGGASSEDDTNADDESTDAAIVQLQEMVERFQQAKKVPRTDQLILQGKVTRYFHAPILALTHVTAEEISEKDRAMADLGFAWVCDSASEKFGESISRSYAGVSNAIGMFERRMPSNNFGINSDGVVIDFSRGAHEFQTYFRDGSTLVTNDVDGATSMPKRRIFVRTYEGLSVAGLFAKHIDGVKRLAQKRNTEPLDHTQFATPRAFAEIVDSLMSRFLGTG